MSSLELLPTLMQKLKQKKIEKGEVSKEFKFIEKNTQKYQQLLIAMKVISEEIGKIEKQIKLIKSTETILENTSKKNHPPIIKKNTPINYHDPFSIEIRDINNANDWSDFIAKEISPPYHSIEWLQIIKGLFSHESIIVLAKNSNKEIIGGIPLTFFSSLLFGKFACSIPFVNYGGFISNYENVIKALIEKCEQLRKERRLKYIEIRTMTPNLEYLCAQKKASMILELPDSDSILEEKIGAKVRAQYKRAEEHEPQFKHGKNELLNDFYKVFSRNMRDLGTPVYPKNFFGEILKNKNIISEIVIIYIKNKPVSCGFLIKNNDMLEIPWASTIKSANSKNANMWMYRKILSYAISNKYKFFDFGRSTINAGTYKFKKQWGAEPYQHYWYYLQDQNAPAPELNPDNKKMKFLIRIWQLMPVWLSKAIGPIVIRNIP